MQSIHNPVRGQSESFDTYKKRRTLSKKLGQAMALIGKFKPSGISSREDFRNTLRKNGTMKKHSGAFSRGLRNAINRKQLAALAT